MSRTRAALFALCVLTLAACDDDDGIGPRFCTDETTTVDIQVTGGTSPTVSWTPACAVALFLVEGDAEGDTWLLSTDDTTWDTPSVANRIEPPVAYGTVPAGIDERAGALPLVAGRSYQVVLWRIQPTGILDGCIAVFEGACMIGLESFTP